MVRQKADTAKSGGPIAQQLRRDAGNGQGGERREVIRTRSAPTGGGGRAAAASRQQRRRRQRRRAAHTQRTLVMNFLQTERISGLSVAENIMTCFSCGVSLKMAWTSERMSGCRGVQGAEGEGGGGEGG